MKDLMASIMKTAAADIGSDDERRAFNRNLLSMVIPLAFQNLMTAMVSASDALMLGVLEQEALSAVSLAGQVTFVLNLCITVLVQGTTMLAAQYWGKGDGPDLEGRGLSSDRRLFLYPPGDLPDLSVHHEDQREDRQEHSRRLLLHGAERGL